MICYLSQSHLQQFQEVHPRLRERKAHELEKMWRDDYGIKPIGYTDDGAVIIDFRGTRIGTVSQFLGAAGIEVVTVEPRDIIPLFGGKVDPTSVHLVRLLENDPAAVADVTDIRPDEIHEKLTELAWQNPRLTTFDPEMAALDMKH
jgi:hypothetical protein